MPISRKPSRTDKAGRIKEIAGAVFFSPVLLLLILLAVVASRMILWYPFQQVIMRLGEMLAGRPLNPEAWSVRFYRWGWTGLICSVPAVLSWAVLFVFCKLRRLKAFDWSLAFVAVGLWILFALCIIPVERTWHLAIYFAALALGLIITRLAAGEKLAGRDGSAGHIRSFVLAVLPALTAMLLASAFIDRGHTWGDDFAEYIAQAQVLATGHDNPARPQVGYKYGTAMLLLPFIKLRGLSLLALKVPMVLCFVMFIVLTERFYGKRFGIRKAVVPALLLATCPVLVCFLNNVLSEIPFLLFSSLSVLCFYGVYDKKKGRISQCLWAVAAGFCTMYAYSCRFQGLLLLLTFACTEVLLLLGTKSREGGLIRSWAEPLSGSCLAAHVCFYLSFALTYIVYALAMPGSSGRSDLGYLESLSLKGMAGNAIFYPFFFNDFFNCNGHCPRIICVALYLTSLPPIVLGIVRKAREEAVCVIYSLGLLAVYVIWPGPRDFRFLFPILPFMLLFAAYGFDAMKDSGLKQSYKAFSVIIVCAFFICTLYEGLQNLKNGRSGDYQAFSLMAQESYDYIRENTGPDEKILFFKPRVLYLATGRSGGWFPKSSLASHLEEFDYILFFDNSETPEANPGVEPPQGMSLELVFSNACFRLCRIAQPGSQS